VHTPAVSLHSNARLRALFRTLSAGGGVEKLKYDHNQAYVFAPLSFPLLLIADSTIPRVALPADVLWHFRKCLFCELPSLMLGLIRHTGTESMKPGCVRFQA
jgi:hypothetical protein